MRDLKKWLSLAAVGITLTGCVSQGQYKKALSERDAARQELQSVRTEADEYRNQLGAVTEASASKDEEITNLSGQNAELQAQLDDINARYAEALERANNPLPPALATELTEFCAKNSDICEFDAKHGMVRFKSDVSFTVGSSVLTPKAKEVVTKLAKILKDDGVKGYELMIAGHTDASPVQSSATIKAGHPDNWFLSAHRAISVGKCLQSCQVSAGRMAMVGYADQRPAASNETEKGRAKNRRVELLILPTKAKEVAADWLSTGKKSAKATKKVSQDATAQTETGPSYNK